MRRTRTRFAGAGGTSLRKFRELRRESIRADRRDLVVLTLLFVGFVAGAWRLHGFPALACAGGVGVVLTLTVFYWLLGGRASNLRWWWGVQGERFTAQEIERLGNEWHCEHDVETPHGNWDHVLIGPPGVFLLDSKALNNASRVEDDALRSGRLRFRGSDARGSALEVHRELTQRFDRVPWVQGVYVVWGEFPQHRHEEQNVVYVHGLALTAWLESLPRRIDRPYQAALVTALTDVRASMLSRSDPSL